MAGAPRVAFFTDTFNGINGVALTSQEFVNFAGRWHVPFLCVRGAEATRRYTDRRPAISLHRGGRRKRAQLAQRASQAGRFARYLRGEPLAEAYANMDVFAFPSRTDTFGNVVLEAFASGVPAVVTDAGGPKFIVRDGVTGYVAANDAAFIERTALLLSDSVLRSRMGQCARAHAMGESWDTVFGQVLKGYLPLLRADHAK